jgi:hypothetical protein
MERRANARLLFGSEALPALLELLLENPRRRFGWKEIHHALAGTNPDSLYRALNRAIELGVVRREAKGRYGIYAANTRSPIYRDLRGLLRKLEVRPSSHSDFRPESLAQVGARLANPDALTGDKLSSEAATWLFQFLDDFRASRRRQQSNLIKEEPPPTGNDRLDAYVAALAEYLAQEAGLRAPDWVDKPERFLKTWWIEADVPSERPAAVAQSPAQFRRRGVFIPERELARS